MAGFSERINLIIDVATGNARSSLKNLKTDLANADGAFAKTKVGASALWDNLKVNAGVAAAGAATAIAGFAAKAVSDFQDTALGAGKLRDALGVTAEEASQLQEVAGDLGVGVKDVETAIGRMNKTAGSSPEAFDEIGAAIVRNKDGSMDVIGTFENVAAALDRIPDAGKRADAAQRIFGRSWQNIAELIADGADGIRDSLEGVEKAKIIDDAEVERARKFRDTLDQLRGVSESASIVIGGELVDAMNTWAEAGQNVKSMLDDLIPGGIGGPVGRLADDALKLTNGIMLATEGFELFNKTMGDTDIKVSSFADDTLTSSEAKLRLATDAASAFEARLADTGDTATSSGDEIVAAMGAGERATDRLASRAAPLGADW
jgi:hypothetical protein